MSRPTSKRAKPSPGKRIAHAAVEVINDWGLHARPSAALGRLAKGFDAKITIRHDGRKASASSIAQLLILEAVKGSHLELEAEGPDAEEAIAALAGMFADGFGEDHRVLPGEGSRCGVAVGGVHILHQANDIPHYSIPKTAVAQEQKRLAQAIKDERRHVRELDKGGDRLIAEFSSMMLGMLDEEHVAAQPAQQIRAGLVNAEWALKVCLDEVIEQFNASGNEVIQAHANDYSQMLLRLVGRMAATRRKRAKVREGTKRVVVSASVGAADVIDCYRAGYAGLVTSSGSYSSHAAILARGLGMPALFAVDAKALRGLAEDTQLILDSDAGELHVKPDKEVVKRFAKKTARRRPPAARGKAPAATKTRDGVRVHLHANIEFLDELAPAYAAGAEGIGLYRTEFLFLNRDDEPGEEEQYVAYAAAVKGSGGRPVTFRTADIGHDKGGDGSSHSSAMGLRGIRDSLRRPAAFKEQLRALLRASAHGPMRIMLPMVVHAAELDEAVRLLREAASETGQPPDRLPPVGVMIEIPGAVYAMPQLARRADFFAIGTNDLIQYALAVDRNLAEVAELADSCHPGVISLLARTVRQGKELGREVTMCGELAADPLMACLYCTLGLRGLSMGAGKIEAVRAALGRHSIRGRRRLAERLAAGGSAAEIRELLQGFAEGG
ncbi:MAG: HPr family phosphocarrier protein [Betaproteobacteria bacterium AqS2]|uniref:Phosphoenolpyruvate-protein phosphotransferase n=1 Tax=Candidatus Amphirhobacter heronislandensis TaxID=1732024 RepID=A0A930XXK6_9GAMM|nr:HPr family phosphocarrier protein [Betaproteobacteria bacterium AqS2]